MTGRPIVREHVPQGDPAPGQVAHGQVAHRGGRPAVTTYVCSNCGEHNAPGTTFCVNCHAFLAWDDVASEEEQGGSEETVIPTRTDAGGQPSRNADDDDTAVRPAVTETTQATSSDGTDGGLLVNAEESSVTVPATGEPASLAVQVMNTSTIVDGYGVEAPGAEPWLLVDADPIHLLPNSEDTLSVRLWIKSTTLVPAQQFDAVLRIHSITRPGVQHDLPIQVTVPLIDAPVLLRAEP